MVQVGQQTQYRSGRPDYRAAGVTTKFSESAAEALDWQEQDRAETPKDIKKWRQSAVNQPGQICKHPGVAEDSVPQGPFGVTGGSNGESVNNVLKNYPQTDMQIWNYERNEDIYKRNQREPLGKSYQRNYNIPANLGSDIPFGSNLDKQAQGIQQQRAIDAILPVDRDPTEDYNHETHKLYSKSHGDYLPGEQKRRGYNWGSTGINPSEHRFGAVDKTDMHDGVALAINPDKDVDIQKPSKIINKTLDQFKSTTDESISKPQQLGHGNTDRNSRTFGVPSCKGSREPGVEELIRGWYTEDEQRPDYDLGKATRAGWRNVAPQEKTFGIPTVRTDIPFPKKPSIANPFNYGMQPNADMLLHPCSTADRGVSEQYYLQIRPKDEIKSIALGSGMDINDADFDQVFQAASAHDNKGQDVCSLETFLQHRKQALATQRGI